MSGLENDLIPYGMALGNRAHLSGLNIVGLQRRGFSRDQIHSLRRAYRLLFADEGTLAERTRRRGEGDFEDNPIVQEIVAFIRVGGKRGLCVPHIDTEPASAHRRSTVLAPTAAARPMDRIGILAGGGRLPVMIAESVVRARRQRAYRRHRG